MTQVGELVWSGETSQSIWFQRFVYKGVYYFAKPIEGTV